MSEIRISEIDAGSVAQSLIDEGRLVQQSANREALESARALGRREGVEDGRRLAQSVRRSGDYVSALNKRRLQ